jgi:DNA ligase-1
MASPKLDGIRCIIHPEDGPVTRNLKPIPNIYIYNMLRRHRNWRECPFDGELIVGDPTKPNTWNTSSSGIMSGAGFPDFTFFVFDMLPRKGKESERFEDRYYRAAQAIAGFNLPWLKLVRHPVLLSLPAIRRYEEKMVAEGYEGIMTRDPKGLYKWGRSTSKEQWLMKLKRFHDAEARVTGIKERLHNANVAKINKLGYTERSGHKANKIGMKTLGALIVRTTFKKGVVSFFGNGEVEFDIGTGFDDKLRAEIWKDPRIIGKIVKFKYQKLSPDGKPIFPVFLGFRED